MKNVLFLFFNLLIAFESSAQSNWHYLPDAPISQGRIDDVFFLNSKLGWCAGSSGKIYKTLDGGDTWELVFNTHTYLRCIEFFDENIGYAGSLENQFLRTTDGGYTWTNLAPGIFPNPQAVCGVSIVDSLYAYAVGEWDSPGFFLKTSNGGTTWTSQDMTAYAKGLVDVFFLSRDTGYVTGKGVNEAGVILYTTNGGQSWTKLFESTTEGKYVWKIQRVRPDFWVASIQTFGVGRFAKSLDGINWTQHNVPIYDMQGIGFATPLHGWVGNYNDGFFETEDGGTNWSYKNFGGDFNRFYFLDSTLAFASGWSIFKFSDTTMVSTQQPLQHSGQDDGFKIELSPNPAHADLNIRFELPVRDNLYMAIYAPDGRFVQEIYHERQVVPGSYQFQVDVSRLSPGAYYLGVQRNHGLYTRAFTRQ